MHYTHKQIAAARKIAKAEFGVNSLLSFNSDPKTRKSNLVSDDFMTVILYIAPSTIGGFQVCASSTHGCESGCLHTAGNPVYQKNKDAARLARKRLFFLRRDVFKIILWAEITKWKRKAEARGLRLAVRLNGTSDVVWERVWPELFVEFSDVQFYDYTKHLKRMSVYWTMPINYDLTLSLSESNGASCAAILATNPKAKVAIVFDVKRTKPLPTQWAGYSVDDGDTHDMTFLRPSGWIGLRAKGLARRDDSGFVVKV